jgi:hypothetical protein
MTASELVRQAVELAVERHPGLIVEPYYQMKKAAEILAEVIVNAPIIDTEPRCSCEKPHGSLRCLNCWLPLPQKHMVYDA